MANAVFLNFFALFAEGQGESFRAVFFGKNFLICFQIGGVVDKSFIFLAVVPVLGVPDSITAAKNDDKQGDESNSLNEFTFGGVFWGLSRD